MNGSRSETEEKETRRKGVRGDSADHEHRIHIYIRVRSVKHARVHMCVSACVHR